MSILSRRLQAVADMVTPGSVIADVGCDHAYLSIYLIKKGICDKVIACDINEGPLNTARNNVRDYGYNEQIDIRLGNGLAPVKEGEINGLVIAGMGGRLMIDILTAGCDVLKNVKEVIISPQSEVALVRHFLEDNGYCIISENMVKDEGKFYPIIKAIHGHMHLEDEVYYRYGKVLIREDNPVLREFLINQKNHYGKLLFHISDSGESEDTQKRIEELAFDLKICERALAMITEPEMLIINQKID